MLILLVAGADGGHGGRGGNQAIAVGNWDVSIFVRCSGGKGGNGQIGTMGGNGYSPPSPSYTNCEDAKSATKECIERWPWYQCAGDCRRWKFTGSTQTRRPSVQAWRNDPHRKTCHLGW
jgi:hypothetical protein